MLGKVKTIICFNPKKRLINIDVDGLATRTYAVEGNRNYKRWENIKVGDYLTGLEWFDQEARIIDADSQISVLK